MTSGSRSPKTATAMAVKLFFIETKRFPVPSVNCTTRPGMKRRVMKPR